MDDNLRFMIAIAENGSISKAAMASGISQSALSQRLKQLEGELGCQLFDRSHTPIRLTASGEVYLAYAKHAIEEHTRMRREVFAVSTGRKRQLRVGISIPRCRPLLTDALCAFANARPGCSVVLREAGNPETMQRLMESEEIDIAVFTPVLLEPAAYEAEVLCHEHPVLLAPRGYPARGTSDARGRRHVRLEQIGDMPFIMPLVHEYYDTMIRRIMDAAGVHLNIVAQCCDFNLASLLVRRRMGVTIITNTSVVGSNTGDVDVYDIDGMEGSRELYYLQRRGWKRTEDAQEFLRLIRAQIKRWPELG
jgi:DNA-binding transcriptional LysR family regulator